MAGIFSRTLMFFQKIMGGKVDPCSVPTEGRTSCLEAVDFSGFTPEAVSLWVVDYENGNPILSEPEFLLSPKVGVWRCPRAG